MVSQQNLWSFVHLGNSTLTWSDHVRLTPSDEPAGFQNFCQLNHLDNGFFLSAGMSIEYHTGATVVSEEITSQQDQWSFAHLGNTTLTWRDHVRLTPSDEPAGFHNFCQLNQVDNGFFLATGSSIESVRQWAMVVSEDMVSQQDMWSFAHLGISTITWSDSVHLTP